MTHVHCGSKTDPVALITSFRTHELGVNFPEHQSRVDPRDCQLQANGIVHRDRQQNLWLKHLRSTAIIYSLIHIPSNSFNAPHKDGRPTSRETILWSS